MLVRMFANTTPTNIKLFRKEILLPDEIFFNGRTELWVLILSLPMVQDDLSLFCGPSGGGPIGCHGR